MLTHKQMLVVVYIFGEVLSANDVIESIYFDDIKRGTKRETCQFYNHLNKEFDKLLKKNLLEHVGYKSGKKKMEKTWRLTEKGFAHTQRLLAESHELAA